MSGVTFNRNRVRLKKVLGIRARLALLAVMLVAPLMLDRVRTLENFRTSQIAQAAAGYANLTARAAETQREVVSSVETMLKSAAYIRASGGIAQSCEVLRASLPTVLPWIRSIMFVSRDGLVQCSTLNMQVGMDLGDREYFKKAQDNSRLRVQRLSARQDQWPPDDDGRLSGGSDQSGAGFGRGRRHQHRLAVADHGQSRRPARHGGRSRRQHRRRDRRPDRIRRA